MNLYADKHGIEYDLTLTKNGICWLYQMKRGFKLKAAGKPEHDDCLPIPIPEELLLAHFTKVKSGQDEFSRKFKTPLSLLFLSFLIACHPAQKIDTGTEFKQAYQWQRTILPASLSLLSGACYGVHETVVHHPDRIPDTWDRQWWDNRLSWRNKYKHGDPEQGPAWFGAEHFTFGQDAKHTFATGYKYSTLAAGITIGFGKRRPALHYLYDIGISIAASAIGFHTTYSILFRQ